MRKFETKTASWSRHRRQNFLVRLVSLTLCFALFVSSTGMAMIGEDAKTQQDAELTMVSDVVPGSDETGDNTGADDGSDVLPGDTGTGDAGENPGGTGENPGETPENPGDGPVDPGTGPDDNLPEDNSAEIAAALERFNIALDAFRADYTYELSNHGAVDHVCRWTQFEDALNLATAVKTSVSELIANDAAVLAGLDETNAMLSVCAAGAYESRAAAVLVRTDYTGMTQFDADVARVDSLLKYMLDAELNSGVITGLRADLTQMRVDLAAALEGGSGGTGEPENPDNPDNPDNPENPDADAILAIAAAYEALNAGWQAMSFDAVLAEIGRIQAMIGGLSDAGKADINVVTVGEYLITIQSAAAVAELGARVAALQIESLDAPGLADRIAEAKALTGYMTAGDMAGATVTGHLAALDAILETLNAPVVSDAGKKFVADVGALKGSFDASRLHAMSKQVSGLRSNYDALVETDKADASVIAALAELDAMRAQCDGLDSNIKAFLIACDALFDAYAQAGFDIGSESARALGQAVADAFAVLDESSFDNVEVVEYYTRLEAAGLLPKDDIAAQIDFQVKMDRLENTSAVEAYSAGMGSKIQVFKLEHNSSANMGAGDVEYSDDYFRSYAILGLDAQDVNGTALGLDFSITVAGETDRANGNYIQQVYASTKSYDEIDALVNQIAQTDFATATYTMEDLLAEHFVELVGDNAAAPAGTRCYIVAYDVDAQGANVSARCNISVNIGGGDWTTAAPGTSVSYQFRGVTEPGNRVADPEDVNGIGTWQYSRVGGVEGDGVFVDDAVFNNGTVRLVARELSGTLSDENGVGMGDIALALFTYDAGTDAYTRLERDISGNRLADVLSADDGSYLFDKLPAGDYYIAMRGAGLNNKAAGAGMIKVTDRMHGLDGWTFVSEGAVSFKTLQQFNTDILLGSSEYVQVLEWSGKFEAGLPPYEVFVTWMDGQPGATLSEDKTHADWVIDSYEAACSVGKSFQIEIVVHEDLPVGTKLLQIPQNLCVQDFDASVYRMSGYAENVGSSLFTYDLNSSAVRGVFSESSVLAFVDNFVVTKEVVSSGFRVLVPIQNAVRYRASIKNTEGKGNDFILESSVDFIGAAEYVFDDCLGSTHVLSFTRAAGVQDISMQQIRTPSRNVNGDSRWPSGNYGSRIFSWSPTVEQSYGLSESVFESLVASGKVVLEFVTRIAVSSTTLGYISYDVNPGEGGIVVGASAGSVYANKAWPLESFRATTKYSLSNLSYLTAPIMETPYYETYGSSDGSFVGMFTSYNTYFSHLFDCRFNVSYGITQDKYFSVLVAYDGDSIFDDATSTVAADCDVIATAHPYVGDKIVSTDIHMSVNAPYTALDSDGDNYSLRVNTGNTSNTNLGTGSGMTALLLGLDASGMFTRVEGTYKMPSNIERNNVSLVFDALSVYSRDNRSVDTLVGGDYCIESMALTMSVGEAYFSDVGDLVSIEQDVLAKDDVISVYVCTAESPDVWVHDYDTTVGSVITSRRTVFQHDDILRVRVDYNGRSSFVKMTIDSDLRYHADGPVMASVLEAMRTSDGYNTARFGASGVLLSTTEDGTPLVVCDESQVSGAWANDLHALSQSLYVSDGYVSGVEPLRNVIYTERAASGGSFAVGVDAIFYEDDSFADYVVASRLSLSYSPLADVNSDATCMRANTARYFIILPDTVDVVSIVSGVDKYTTHMVKVPYFNVFERSSGISSGVVASYPVLDVRPTITYRVLEDANIDGFVVYEVVSTMLYDKKSLVDTRFDDSIYFGYFVVTTRPKYTEKFMTDDTRMTVASYIVDPDDSTQAYSDGTLWSMRRDGGWNFAHLPDDAGLNFLWDMDRDGDTSERILATIARYWNKGNPAVYVSGLQFFAQGSMSRFFNQNATTSPTDPYHYKMTYQQAIEPSTNVVMYNSIEDISGNTWGGVLTQIDMSDADRQNIAYTIYGNRSRIDSLNYVQSKFNHENLRRLEDGWFVIDSSTDLSTVKSIAIDFGSHEFQRDENNKPATVSVVYTMTPPAGGFAAGQTSIGNRAFFSDTLKGSGVTRTVMANQVTVTMDTEVGGGISKTIVPVQSSGAEPGDGSQDGSNAWVDTYDEAGNKITLDKTGKPADAYQYQYHLKYTMDDPGAGSYNSVRNVILYDNLENGTDSKYAGRLTDISVTGVDAFFVELGQGHVPPGGGSGSEEPVGGEGDDVELLAMPFSLLPDNSGVSYTGLAGVDVYVNYDGMSVSTNLPDGLVDATGIQDWALLGSLSDGNVLSAPEGANIRHVAVVVPELTTMHESGLNATPYQESYIDVALTMEHAGRTDCFGNDKIIRNNMLVSYQVPGVDDPVVVGLPSEQEPELEVIYRDAGFALPVTGGSGWFIPTVSGIGCIVLAASWIMSERKWRRRMAAVMASQSGSDSQQ